MNGPYRTGAIVSTRFTQAFGLGCQNDAFSVEELRGAGAD
jgi:hypothetical protein